MSWTAIADTAIDADSPVTETLMTQIVENTEYNQERALRCGNHATGVRLALARGRNTTEFSISTSATGEGSASVAITFADAVDGDPNFTSAPYVWVSFDEGGTLPAWDAVAVFGGYVEKTTLSATGATVRMAVQGGNNSATLRGYMNWFAIGPVTSGE